MPRFPHDDDVIECFRKMFFCPLYCLVSHYVSPGGYSFQIDSVASEFLKKGGTSIGGNEAMKIILDKIKHDISVIIAFVGKSGYLVKVIVREIFVRKFY